MDGAIPVQIRTYQKLTTESMHDHTVRLWLRFFLLRLMGCTWFNAGVYTMQAPTQPIGSKNKSQSQTAQCEWTFIVVWYFVQEEYRQIQFNKRYEKYKC